MQWKPLRGEGKIKQTNRRMTERNARKTQEAGLNEEEQRGAEGLHAQGQRTRRVCVLGFALSIKVGKTVKDRDGGSKRDETSERGAKSGERRVKRAREKKRVEKARKDKDGRKERREGCIKDAEGAGRQA